MIEEFEEGSAHQIHRYLTFSMVAEQMVEIEDNYQYAIDIIKMFSLNDDLYDLKEVILVESCRKGHSPLNCNNFQIF